VLLVPSVIWPRLVTLVTWPLPETEPKGLAPVWKSTFPSSGSSAAAGVTIACSNTGCRVSAWGGETMRLTVVRATWRAEFDAVRPEVAPVAVIV
jgi:hypothetical protein